MYIGHYAVAFAAKRVAPQTSLGTLLLAAMFLDLIWPLFFLLGWEKVEIDPGNTAFTPLNFVSYPISHSLVTVIGWSLLFGLVYLAITRYKPGAIVAGLLVLSHWLLDALVHRPDLPLYPGSTVLVGLGIWNSVFATLVLEGAMFAGGLWLYLRATQPKDRAGIYSMWVFIALTVVIYLGSAFGPPPPSAQAIAWIALGELLFPIWAWWFDRHRVAMPQVG